VERSYPLLVSVEFGRWRARSVGYHREARALHGTFVLAALTCLLTLPAANLSNSWLSPSRDPGCSSTWSPGPAVDELPVVSVLDEFIGGHPAKDAAREIAKPFARVCIIGTTKL